MYQTEDTNAMEQLQEQADRYQAKVVSLKEYLESSHLSMQESLISFDESYVGDNSFMPFGQLEPSEYDLEYPEQVSQNIDYAKMIWNGLEKLAQLLPSVQPINHTPQFKPRESDLFESFMLMSPDKEHVKVNIPRSDKEMDVSLMTRNQLEQEVLQLRESLQHLTESSITKESTAVEELMHENVMLKKSIINFKSHLQKKTTEWNKSMLLPPNRSARFSSTRENSLKESRFERRIADLQEIVNELEKQLQEKEELIEELQSYKKKWNQLKANARKKKVRIVLILY
eukprot:TRINITY_DN1991_c0_g1_i2.p1 TRINITY_DN1991_c0_g1~~TRINITY_DN1991_c0_g1_i2.p1  ORF type:complete len:329 (-),score=77.18 TRINITY_DN1991_c0_g1_i2:1143-1997(-)